MTKRIKAALIIILLCITAVSLSVVRCMVFYDTEALGNLSRQYFSTVEYIYPRGDITDRSGISFNHSFSSVFPDIRINSDEYPAVAPSVVGKTTTDPADTTSGAKYGVNGINEIFDDLLNGGSPVKVSSLRDASGNLITSAGSTVTGNHLNEGCDIALTLDYVLQRETEEIMRESAENHGFEKMAVTVTDASTGEIIVMATAGSEMNLNVLTYPPGSIMKIISAACALEEGIIKPDDEFVCHGEFPVGENTRYCSGKAVHGKMTMKEAFAVSCNEWAYTVNSLLCEEHGGIIKSKALELAKKWGFCEYGNESHEFVLEYSGYYSFVPKAVYNEMDIFNSALGQGNIQASVYLVNKITAAIANGGEVIAPYIVSSVTDPAGNTVFENSGETFSLGLKDETVEYLREFMRQTCISGSAKDVITPLAAGKTGTAENIPGEECHSWFTGYFPTGDKNYAVTVFIENGSNAPSSAVPLWDAVAENIQSFYGQK